MPQVRLGGNKASGANRMYFCLIHAYGDLTGRVSAPPGLAPPLSPASGVSSLEDAAFFSARGVAAFSNDGGGGDSEGNQGDQVAVESTDHSQLFRFWDSEANGKLVQAPLDLDRQGRGWCKVCVVCVFARGACWTCSGVCICAERGRMCVYVSLDFSLSLSLSRCPRFRV